MGKILHLQSRIRIISPPKASPRTPRDIQWGFVGVEFPVEKIVPALVRYGKVELYDYLVDKQKALRILRRKASDTADFIEKHPEIYSEPYLAFCETVCERVGFYKGGMKK